MTNLPNHRRPRGMGHGSTGPAGDHVFAIGAAPVREAGLVVRRDPARPDKHAFVEPGGTTPLVQYRSALSSTQGHWSRAWP